MKLIPDSNSENKYNRILQNIVNTLVTIVVLSVAVTSVKIGSDVFNDRPIIRAEISTSDLSISPTLKTSRDFCYYNADIDVGYNFVKAARETVVSYATNYAGLDTGIVITNEMLMAMSQEHNLLKSNNYKIGGFHLYFADKEATGGNPSNPSIVFVPINHAFLETDVVLNSLLTSYDYGVLEVPAAVCGPCPLLCDSSYQLY